MERWNETEATNHKGTNRTTDRKGNQGKVERCKGKQGQGKERKRKQMKADGSKARQRENVINNQNTLSANAKS